jgi:hypothetical protein
MNTSERRSIEGLGRQALALRHLAESILHQCQSLLDPEGAQDAGNVDAPPKPPGMSAGDEDDPLNPPRFGRASTPRRQE